MTLTTDDFVKIALTVSVCFAIIGIAWQFMRMLSELVETVKESNLIVKLGHEFLEKFMEDYDYLIEQIKFIVEAISGFSRSVFIPLGNIFGFLKKFENIPFMKGKKEKGEDKEK